MAGNPYLFLYNAALVLGWGYCLYLTVDTMLLKSGTTRDLWKEVELPLKVSQTAAILEVLHSAIGLVRSPVAITGMQVASRLWVLWGIVNLAPAETTGGALALPIGGVSVAGVPLQLSLATLLAAWSFTEVVRYSFYAIKEVFGSVPYLVLWLRYSTFIPLYPIGVASELTMAWLALPSLKATHVWSLDMPNRLNFAFDYYLFCILIMLTYIHGLPQLYMYMLAQRRKVLGGISTSGTAKKTQ